MHVRAKVKRKPSAQPQNKGLEYGKKKSNP
jgi:hypothetical protein